MKEYEQIYSELKELGVIIGETTPQHAVFLSTRPARLGEYVIVQHDEGPALAMVEQSFVGNPFLPSELKDLNVVEKTIEMIGNQKDYTRAKARLLSSIRELLEGKKPKSLKTPPKTGYKVYEASPKILKKIFAPEADEESFKKFYYKGKSSNTGYVRIGVLANHPEVPVYIKINPMVLRHTAVLAITGAGKSNTISILSERIVNGFNGTIVIFDMHGEYIKSEIGGEKSVKIQPKLNPNALGIREIRQLASFKAEATRQERVLRLALYSLKKMGKTDNIIEDIISLLEKIYQIKEELKNIKKDKEIILEEKITSLIRELTGDQTLSEDEELKRELTFIYGMDADVLFNVINKLEDVKLKYRHLLDSEASMKIENIIIPGKLNIIDLSELDEDASDVVVSYIANTLLNERKKFVMTNRTEGYPSPVFLVLEEAHILVPRNNNTFTKDVIARIAREGRKFGIGICLVSQRPKNIDENALSQTNNKIILKIIEPEDQRYVQKASEQMSNELLQLLTSLDVGEAILLGEFTVLPALVKIDEHKRKLVGRDPNITEEWEKSGEFSPEKIIDEIMSFQEEL